MKILQPILFCLLIITSCQQKKETLLASKENKKKTPEILWSDEFNGNTVDITKWLYNTGASGWGNNELQNYTEGANATVSDGTLKITVEKVGKGQNIGDYTSSRMISNKAFTYGRMEIRAKMPDYKGKGIWPAIWMLGKDIKDIGWPNCGEIDIMEYVSKKQDSVLQTIHSVANNHTNGTQISTDYIALKTIEEEFHNYGIIWKEDKLQFYIDSPENITLTVNRPEHPTNDNWPFAKEYFFILNIAVGGNLGGEVDDNIFPAQMEVDYVRVYKE